jgi:O-Antigen ligase
MPADQSLTTDGGRDDGYAYTLWVPCLAFLVGIWIWLALSSGGYPAENWVFPLLALGLFGLVVSSLLAYPRRPRQLSLAVLGLCGAYSVWVLASTLWAGATPAAWLGSGRTFGYLLVLALALAFFASTHVRAAFRYLLIGAALVLLVVSIWRLWSAPQLDDLFEVGRLIFPASTADATAALFLVLFWPLMWLAAAPNERAPVRGAALGLASGLLGVAVLTQSRGAAWSMVITLVLVFVLSPGRLRLLFYLVVPGLLMAYAAPLLNRYWTGDPQVVHGGLAGRTLTIVVLAGGFMGMILALLEGWIRVSRRMKTVFGTVILVGCAAGLIYAAATPTMNSGSITWVDEIWQQFLHEPTVGEEIDPEAVPAPDGLRSPSRQEMWRLSWRAFLASPLHGAGVDNSISQPRGDPRPGSSQTAAGGAPRGASGGESQEPNSFLLQVLSDTGIVGGVLAFGAVLVAATGMLWPRLAVGFRHARRGGPGQAAIASTPQTSSRWGSDPMAYGWEMALFAGVAYWFVHANFEKLWRVPGVTIPALLMLAAVVASTDARAGTLWPRIAQWTQQRSRVGPPGPAAGSSSEIVTRSLPFGRLQPPGPLSQGFRIALISVSGLVVVLAASAYLLLLL